MANHIKAKTTKVTFHPNYLLDQAILSALAEGVFISPQSLLETLRSESEINQDQLFTRLQALQAAGLALDLDQKGVQLKKPVDCLNPEQLIAMLNDQNHNGLINIHLASTLSSTNQYLLENPVGTAHRRLCVTEYQNAGRGRRGRSWSAAYASSLCFSLSWNLPADERFFPLISLLPAVVIAEVLNEHGWPVTLKWPNDVLLYGKKFCGILIENRPYQDENAQQRMALVIGAGINVYASDMLHEQVDQPWSALDQFQSPETRTALLALIVNRLISELEQVEQEGIDDLTERWSKYDTFRDQTVQVNTEQQTYLGIARGLDASGALQVEVNKQIMQFTAGEVSLRLHNG